MELKHWNTKITYKIEPNPAGGFVARSSDLSIAPIEAASMEEMQQKIQTQIMGSTGTAIPGLNIPAMLVKAAAVSGKTISRTVTSTTSNGSVVTKEASPEEVKQFAQQFASVMQKDFPELAQEISAKAERLSASNSVPRNGVFPEASVRLESSNLDTFPQDPTNWPILPETNATWKLLGILAVTLVLALTILLYAHQ